MLTVMFVDDEPMLLEGLRRALREMRDEWTMLFATGGEEALGLLEDRPVDVVVSDMRMPGMDGRQFLRTVKERHPGVARLMLSGHAQQASLLEAVGCAQQFLAKPCDVSVLHATIARTLSLRELLAAHAFALDTSVDTLPALPSAYEDLVHCVQSPEMGLKEAAAIIGTDPSMTATLLKVANSAFFGPPRPVTTLERACSFLGMEVIAGLVLTGALVAAQPALFAAAGPLAGWHEHSLRVASIARNLAVAESMGDTLVNQAFLAGLMHDVGFLVLAMQGRPGGVFVPGPWREQPGDDHAVVGAYLLASWGFPDAIVEAVAWHHDVAHQLRSNASACQLIYLADCFARSTDFATPEAAGLDAAFVAQPDFAGRWPLLQQSAARMATIQQEAQ